MKPEAIRLFDGAEQAKRPQYRPSLHTSPGLTKKVTLHNGSVEKQPMFGRVYDDKLISANHA